MHSDIRITLTHVKSGFSSSAKTCR
jgi:hypothetical protein